MPRQVGLVDSHFFNQLLSFVLAVRQPAANNKIPDPNIAAVMSFANGFAD
jgi:hypothetical protein